MKPISRLAPTLGCTMTMQTTEIVQPMMTMQTIEIVQTRGHQTNEPSVQCDTPASSQCCTDGSKHYPGYANKLLAWRKLPTRSPPFSLTT